MVSIEEDIVKRHQEEFTTWVQIWEAYCIWLTILTGPQIRALACQAGRKDWRTATVAKLFDDLYLSLDGSDVFKAVYCG